MIVFPQKNDARPLQKSRRKFREKFRKSRREALKGAELLFQVIADCYERKSLIITTNLEFGKWISIFMDKKLTSAIIDRIIHHSHLIYFTGESYRIKNSTINTK
jgi:DNA replication protein DnaC